MADLPSESLSSQTILITGISGFVAKQCAVELLCYNYRVRGTVRSRNKEAEVRDALSKVCDISKLEFAVADLESEAGWQSALQNVHGVLHVASPVSLVEPRDPSSLIRPAVEGTLRVLSAAAKAGVERFVHTSSVAAIAYGHEVHRLRPFTEVDWSDLSGSHVGTYARSKTMSELAARKFVTTDGAGIHYSSVNPGVVFGPLLDKRLSHSVESIYKLLGGKYPGCPRFMFPVVDVRDVALMHRLALEAPLPTGGRYIATSEDVWFLTLARTIRSLGAIGKRVPGRELPSFLLKAFAPFNSELRMLVPELDLYRPIDNTKTRDALGIKFRPMEESIRATVQSLYEFGLLRAGA